MKDYFLSPRYISIATAPDSVTRKRQEIPSPSSRAIIEMVTTIMVYKFTHLSQAEV